MYGKTIELFLLNGTADSLVTAELSNWNGKAENIKERLLQHLRDHNLGKEKYYWNTALIFLGRDLNKALIRYLENRFVEIAMECDRYKILTKNTYKNTVLKESHVASMEEFIDNVKILANTLGYKILVPMPVATLILQRSRCRS